MGTSDIVFNLKQSEATQLPDGLAIVASPAQIALLAEALRSPAMISALLIPCGPSDPLGEGKLPAGVKALVLEVDPSSAASIRRLEGIRRERPQLPIIAAIADADHADLAVLRNLLRLGIRDVVTLPLSGQELTSRVIDILIGEDPGSGAPARGSLVLFQRSVGGAGATTVMTHAAKLMAEQHPAARICLVDMDVQTGAVAQYLGLDPEVDLGPLLDAGQRMDGDLVSASLLTSEHGFKVLAAPAAIRPLESLDVNHVLRLFDVLRSRFDCVLVDLPSAWSNWSLSLAATCDRVIIVCGTTIASLRQAQRKIGLLAEVGIAEKRIAIVANRLERRLFRAIGAAEMEAALGCQVLASLGSEGNDISAAQDIGRLLNDINRRSKFLAELNRLVVAISELTGAA